MIITVEQFALLLDRIRTTYRNSPYHLDNPRVVAELFVRENPQVERIARPPSPQEVWRNYTPPAWQAHVHPTIRTDPGNCIPWYPGMPSPAEARFAEYQSVGRNPLGSVVFLVMLALGNTEREALTWGNRAAFVFDMLPVMMGRSGMQAASRAVSGNSGQRRDRQYRQTIRDIAEGAPGGRFGPSVVEYLAPGDVQRALTNR